jgi:hypothetical protein
VWKCAHVWVWNFIPGLVSAKPTSGRLWCCFSARQPLSAFFSLLFLVLKKLWINKNLTSGSRSHRFLCLTTGTTEKVFFLSKAVYDFWRKLALFISQGNWSWPLHIVLHFSLHYDHGLKRGVDIKPLRNLSGLERLTGSFEVRLRTGGSP